MLLGARSMSTVRLCKWLHSATNLSARSGGHTSRSLEDTSPFLLPPLSSLSGGYLWPLWSGGAIVRCCSFQADTSAAE